MGNFTVVEHPLIQHKLSIIRNKDTGTKDFRDCIGEIASLLCYEATKDLPLKEIEVETPISTAKCMVLKGKKFAVVPILRAGLGMVDGVLKLVPSAKVGHIGLYRDPKTFEAVKYYCKMPTDIEERDVFVVDPMLATGVSASSAIEMIKEYHPRSIKMMNIIAAQEGVDRVLADHPDVDIFCATLDEKLDDHMYIVPGLGDAGDRIFGTK